MTQRPTKLLLLAWALGALSIEVWLVGGWNRIEALAAAAFLLSAGLTAVDVRWVAVPLAFSYVFPAAIWLTHGVYHPFFSGLWLAALLGAMLPASLRSEWHIPEAWRGPIIYWALAVVFGATIVGLREVDFTPALLETTSLANRAGGGWPAFIIDGILNVAVLQVVGILWFDWLLGLRNGSRQPAVAVPLAVSAAALVGVAIYQMLVDIRFMSASPYASLGRAASTLFDANTIGTIAALWIGASAALAQSIGRYRVPVTAAAAAACWLAVWASGSRTAFAAAVIATAFVLHAAWRNGLRATRLTVVATAAAALSLAILLAASNGAAVGPLARFLDSIPSYERESVSAVLKEQLWVRNGYGTASSAMIARYPLFGVGVGSFQLLLPEFSALSGQHLSPDNAQNWYRHQLAELGVVGSVGWLLWVVAFGLFVLRANETFAGGALRGALVAFAAISFVGMPGQDPSVTITFWTLAAWYLATTVPPRPVFRRAWLATVGATVLLAVFTAGTLYAARHDMRVPMRAKRGGWAYIYGLYPPEPRYEGFRWTARRAVIVTEAPTRLLEVTLSVNHLALNGEPVLGSRAPTRPVVAKIWRDRELVFTRELTDTAPVTETIPVAAPARWTFLETQVSRVIRPREIGIADDRELGMLIKWRFVETPAADERR